MAVPAGPTEVIYIGNGVSTQFPVPFLVLQASDLAVYVDRQRLTSDYIQDGVGKPASTVTFAVAPALNVPILFQLDVPFERLNDYQENGDFLSSTVNNDFDRIWQALKQLLRYAGRVLTLGKFDTDGRGWYHAGGNGIRDLCDPVQPQDAATMSWAKTYIGSLLEMRQSPANNASNILYVDGAGIPGILQGFVGDVIGNNLTVFVPQQFVEPADAMDWLRTKTIVNGAQVTIKIANGITNITRTTWLNHPQGEMIKIVGDEASPESCVIIGPEAATFDAFMVSNGSVFGGVNGIKLDLPEKSEWPYNTTGILALNGARLQCGPNIQVNNWYYGIAARTGSFIRCDFVRVTNAGDVGIWAFMGSSIQCNYAVSNNASDAVNPWGFGFQAEYGSSMICTGASASGCKIGGIAALSNSTVKAHDSMADWNIGSGYVARTGSVIDASGGSATNNGSYGLAIEDGGSIFHVNINTDNVLGSVNAFSFLGAEAGQARVASSKGPMRVDAGGADPIYMNTSGGLQLEVVHVADAANHLYVAGSVAGSPARIGVAGSDADIDLALRPKGNGKIRVGMTQSKPAGFAENSIIELKAEDGATIQIACKRL